MQKFKLFKKRNKVKQKKEDSAVSVKKQGKQCELSEQNIATYSQLMKDAVKCSKCWNAEHCACVKIGSYIVTVGEKEFLEQVSKDALPNDIKEQINLLKRQMIFAYETDLEAIRILNAAKGNS